MSCNTDLLNKKQSVDFIENLTQKICATYTDEKAINHNMGSNVPRESEILTILNQILELVFPGFAEKTVY